MADNDTDKPRLKRASRVSVQQLRSQLRTALARDIKRILDTTATRALARDEAVSLRAYIELTNELAELEKIAELEKLEKKDKPNV